jgi:hypothetical protein
MNHPIFALFKSPLFDRTKADVINANKSGPPLREPGEAVGLKRDRRNVMTGPLYDSPADQPAALE